MLVTFLLIAACNAWRLPAGGEEPQKTSGPEPHEPSNVGRGLVEQVLELRRELAILKETRPPIGSVTAYAGPWPGPATERTAFEEKMGWMLCDGRILEKASYLPLFASIGFTYGNPANAGVRFYLPDYRGRFLRGVTGPPDAGTDISMRDPERDGRGAMFEHGSAGNLVGSVQEDAYKSHTHRIGNRVSFTAVSGGFFESTANPAPEYASRGSHVTGPDGGPETRPKNVYVNWIIRFK